MKIVFIAGAYRGDRQPETIERNTAMARRYQKALAEAGIVAYSPNVHDVYWEELETSQNQTTLQQFTTAVLERLADALVVMPGWEASAGTKVEIEFATKKGLPIFFLKDETDLSELKSWYNTK